MSNYSQAAVNYINQMKNVFMTKGVKPEDIFIDDLYSFNGTIDYSKLSNVDISDLDPESKNTLNQFLKAFENSITDKKSMLEQSRLIFDTDIVQSIIEAIYDDGFNTFSNDNDFKIEFEPDEKTKNRLGDEFISEVQLKIDSCIEKFDLKQLVQDIIPDLVRDGEYLIGKVFSEGKGLTNLIDDIDAIDTIPFYNNTKLSFVLRQVDNNSIGGKHIELINPENITYFSLKSFTKNRIKLDTTFINNNVKKKIYKKTGLPIPKFTRICRPLYYSAIKTINSLKLIEDVHIVQEVSNILRPEVVQIGVPANTTGSDAKSIVRDYERHLNDITKNINIEASRKVDIPTLLNMSLQRKVLPLFADGKGTISLADTSNLPGRSQETRESIQFIRSLIAISVGIVPFYINLNDTPIEKGQLIKLYSRWTKKLTNFQSCIAEGVIDIIYTDLKYSGINIEKYNLKAKFKQITNGDILEDTDLIVATITALKELHAALDEIAQSDNNALKINSEKYKEVWNLYTNAFMNISDLLEMNTESNDINISNDTEDSTGMEPDNTSSTADNKNDNSYDDFSSEINTGNKEGEIV